MKHTFAFALAIFAMGLTSCGQAPTTEKASDHTAEAEHDEHDMALTTQQLKTVGIELGKIERRSINTTVRVNGRTALNPQYQASVTSLVGGIIRSIAVGEGNRVGRGQVVAYIENTEIVALQKDYLTSQSEAVAAEQEHTRQKELASAGAGVQKKLQQATAACRIAKAQLLGIEKQLRQLGINPNHVKAGNIVTHIPIKSPIQGYVDKIKVPVGGYVDMQTPIMDIVDNSKLHCDLSVFESDIADVRIGQTVDLLLTNRPQEKIKGVIYEMNSSFEGSTKSVKAHVHITEKAPSLKLIPDMYLTALIHVGKQETESLPSDAVVSNDGKKYIFMLSRLSGDTCHFSRVEVQTGVSDQGFIQVIAPKSMPKNATVVTSNAFYLSSALGGGEEGHSH